MTLLEALYSVSAAFTSGPACTQAEQQCHSYCSGHLTLAIDPAPGLPRLLATVKSLALHTFASAIEPEHSSTYHGAPTADYRQHMAGYIRGWRWLDPE